MQIHRIVARIGIAVGPDACLGHLKPVGLDKPPKLGVVVAGVEVLETLIIVIAFADEPLGLDRDGGINVEVRDLAKRPVGGPFDQRPGGGRDGAHRVQPNGTCAGTSKRKVGISAHFFATADTLWAKLPSLRLLVVLKGDPIRFRRQSSHLRTGLNYKYL